MGSSVSRCSKVGPDYKSEWLVEFRLLSLSGEDVSKLSKIFHKATSGKSVADISSCLNASGVVPTASLLKIFSLEVDKNKSLDLRAFILSVFNFCSLSFEMMARFIFSLYDVTDSGSIDFKTVLQILDDNYDQKAGSRLIVDKVSMELMEILSRDKKIELHSFVKLSQSHYKILLPVYTAQTQMRRALLGLKHWNQAMQRRTLISYNAYLDVHSYMHLVHKTMKINTTSENDGRTKPVNLEGCEVNGIFANYHSVHLKYASEPNSYSSNRTANNTVVTNQHDNSISFRSIEKSTNSAATVEYNARSYNSSTKKPSTRNAKLGGGVEILDLSAATLRNKRLKAAVATAKVS